LAIFAAIRRAYTGRTQGTAPHAKKSREQSTAPGVVELVMRFDAKAVRQSPIIVRLGADSVNPFPAANIQIPRQRCAKVTHSKAAGHVRQPTRN